MSALKGELLPREPESPAAWAAMEPPELLLGQIRLPIAAAMAARATPPGMSAAAEVAPRVQKDQAAWENQRTARPELMAAEEAVVEGMEQAMRRKPAA